MLQAVAAIVSIGVPIIGGLYWLYQRFIPSQIERQKLAELNALLNKLMDASHNSYSNQPPPVVQERTRAVLDFWRDNKHLLRKYRKLPRLIAGMRPHQDGDTTEKLKAYVEKKL